MIFSADNIEVAVLAGVGFVISLPIMWFVYSYRDDVKESVRSFLVSLGFSFIMITGVAQGLKSFKHGLFAFQG